MLVGTLDIAAKEDSAYKRSHICKYFGDVTCVIYIYTYSNQPPEREAVIIYELIFEGQESYTNTLTPGRSWEFR